MAVNVDLTDVVNNAYADIVKPAVNGAKTCINLLTCGIKPYVKAKIIENEYLVKEVGQKLKEKYECIPDEDKKEPRISILGPATDVLKYNLEEEHIREMFINILTSEMNVKKQNKVLPAYIEIIKQLSKDDADFILLLKNNINLSVLQIRKGTRQAYQEISNYIVKNIKNQNYIIIPYNEIVIDNLKRLEIINVDLKTIYTNNSEICEKAFNNLLTEKHIDNTENKYFYIHGILELTKFGQRFIDICCS